MRIAIFVLLVVCAFWGSAAAETLLIADKTANKLLYFDTGDRHVTRTVSVGENPHEVVVTVDGRRALTANSRSNTVSVIDLEAGKEAKRLDFPLFAYPHGLAAHPNGEIIYITNEQKKVLLFLNVETLTIERSVPTGMGGSHMVVLSPQGERAYVSNRESGTVSMYRTAHPEEPRHAEAGAGAEGIALCPDGRLLLVANRGDDDVYLYDVPALELSGRIDVGDGPVRVACSPDGGRALVSHRASHEVHVLDLGERKTEVRVDVGKEPGGIAFSSDGSTAFIANTGEGTLSVLDMSTLDITGTYPAGEGPDGIVLWQGPRRTSETSSQTR